MIGRAERTPEDTGIHLASSMPPPPAHRLRRASRPGPPLAFLIWKGMSSFGGRPARLPPGAGGAARAISEIQSVSNGPSCSKRMVFAASADQDVLFWFQSKWLSRGRPPNAVVRPFPPAFPAADLAPSSKRTAAGYRAAAAQTVEVLLGLSRNT
jgi:hypothetical protein